MSLNIGNIMVCSRCGNILYIKLDHEEFDTRDCGWECSQCHTLWLSSDGEQVIGNLFIRYR